MSISGIDHINIVTEKLEETVRFYSELLELTRDVIPIPGISGAWMRDAKGDAIIHINSYDPARHGAVSPGTATGGRTGALDHVAMRASDFDGMLARVKAMGAAHRTTDFSDMKLRQIFLEDPNHIRLEFNFFGG